MNEIITSAITRVSLNQATFHNKTFTPSYINFLFGKNRCGKSTVAKVLKDKTDLEWDSGHTAEDFQILVYNEEFISRNIESYDGLPGVFTISEQNAQTQKEIEVATSEMGLSQKSVNELSKRLSEQETLLKKQLDTFQTICWEKTKDFRKLVDPALTGKKKKDGLTNALLAEMNPTEFDADSLVSMCELHSARMLQHTLKCLKETSQPFHLQPF
ncbi:AAA family ATPase [Tuanshanicoccus lijuaniae]|uniref:AAA family ATPase n=1 Tax=Aerococcaceae bacterium zg-1292 TaxID=2774330 RepID=UPI00193843C3|nr:AAA family ATPase [Aerococcaceae bacterium zg-1292]QQA38025.1 AAA family ATPase [Aerococcaceae bacterium zg-1292]